MLPALSDKYLVRTIFHEMFHMPLAYTGMYVYYLIIFTILSILSIFTILSKATFRAPDFLQ